MTELNNNIHQILQQLQMQTQALEHMNIRLNSIESTLQTLTSKTDLAEEQVKNPQQLEEVPPIRPMSTVEHFDTPEKRQKWWTELEEQWQKAFNEGFFGNGATTDMPVDADLQAIFESPSLRFVGSKGLYLNLSFELTNLSGLKHLTNLVTLVVTDHAITSLEGIEHLNELVTLFVQNNQLTTITAVQYLHQLEQLYCQSNALTSIAAIEQLVQLNTLYCNHNPIKDFIGITEQHAEKLDVFYALPNDNIKPNEIRRVEDLGIFCRKG